MENQKRKIPKSVSYWLFIGVFMVFMQVVIGGITRLTDSGLSITEWAVIQGTLPPLNAEDWEQARIAYMEHAIGQVQQKWSGPMYPEGIPMSDFKFIFFWEYFHRLWARLMGFVFLFPFLYFLRKGYINRQLAKQLGGVILIAATAATFGWIMVASGLNTAEYAWVNAYKLTIHLSIAFVLFSYLFWTSLQVAQPLTEDGHNSRLRKFAWRITFVLGLQIILGGLMSGLKAGLIYPNFPYMELAEEGEWIWVADALKERENWSWINIKEYTNPTKFAPALTQLLHRSTAYLLCILMPIFFLNVRRIPCSKRLNQASWVLMLVLTVQVLLGVFTLVNCTFKIPLTLGVLHQDCALILLAVMLYINYQFSKGGKRLMLTAKN